MRHRLSLILSALLVGSAAFADVMHWPDLLDRPRPQATRRIAYGPDALQYVDLWLPAGKPPFPVVLMVHGGCWQTDVAQAGIMNYIAEDLRTRGIAVWNVEYRGIDRPGGSYPGTFQDVAAAADALAAQGSNLGLRTDRVVAFGHSAGGHLALWLAARDRLPPSSPLARAHPLHIGTAISAGGLPDLQAAQRPPFDTCGDDAVHALTGRPSGDRPDVYRDTSPAAMLPIASDQILVNGTKDGIAPPASADAYAAKVAAHGQHARRVTIPGEGHVELIAPGSAAWKAEADLIARTLLRPGAMN